MRICFFCIAVLLSLVSPGQSCPKPLHTSLALPRLSATGASCLFPSSFRTDSVAGLSSDLFDNALTCGMCMEVTGPLGTVEVMVDGECTGCPANSMDISYSHFVQVADITAPDPMVSWRLTECPVAGNVQVEVNSASNQWYLDLLVYNTRYPLLTLELWLGGSYVPILRNDWNHFDTSFNVPSSIQVRLTDIFGQQLVTTLPFVSGSTHNTGAQFPVCSGLSVSESSDTIQLVLFPNPAEDHVKVYFSKSVFGSWEVTDITGRKINSGGGVCELIQVDFENYSPGYYFFTFHHKKGSISKTFIVR